MEIKPDIETIQACLLHDVVEDTSVTVEEIEAIFGK
jgi:(p)ppGpp synthase/HD superfamily hydrolase